VHSSENRRRRWLLVAGKTAILALVAWGVHTTLTDAYRQLRDAEWELRPVWMIAAGAIYLLGMIPWGWYWHRVLVSLGQRPRLFETLRAYYIGHLGKYVPGKALVVIMRAGMVRSDRVDWSIAASSVFVETLTTMACGAMVAAVVLVVLYWSHWGLVAVAVGLALVAGLPTLPPVFRRIVTRVGVGRRDPQWAEKLAGLNYWVIWIGWVAAAVGWVAMGLSLWAALRSIGVSADILSGRVLLQLTAAAALSVVAGFLSLIPGGLGVRDLVLMQLVAQSFGNLEAVGAAVVLRLVWLVAELAISGILYPFRTTMK
jgi:hypothetical protein